jgi:RNA polymerase sigma factor (sigma-70 family)
MLKYVNEGGGGKKDLSQLWLSFSTDKDKNVFSDIYRHLYPELYAYGRKFNIDDDALKDIIQDLFLKIYTKPEIITAYNTFGQFMFMSVRNACINHALYEQKHIDISGFCDFELPADDGGDSLENREEEEIIRRKVNAIMKSLTPRQREIIYLRFFKEMKYEEIAEVMHLSGQATRDLVHRAIKNIREKNEKK